MDEKIRQYSLVDLLEILNDKKHRHYESAKSELENRNPSKQELKIAKNGLEIRTLSKNRSLSTKEKLNAYLIPLYVAVTGSGSSFSKRQSLEFENQIQEFVKYGELKKAEEFEKLKNKVLRVIPIFILFILVVGLLTSYVLIG